MDFVVAMVEVDGVVILVDAQNGRKGMECVWHTAKDDTAKVIAVECIGYKAVVNNV